MFIGGILSQYSLDFDIKYNAKKSNIMVIRSREDRKLLFPDLSLSDTVLKVCKEVKYLRHYISDDLSDDLQTCRMMYAQINMLMCKFSMFSGFVKTTLFRAFCTPMSTVT